MQATSEPRVTTTASPEAGAQQPQLAGMAAVAVLAAAVAGLVIASLPGNVGPIARLDQMPAGSARDARTGASVDDRVLAVLARGL